MLSANLDPSTGKPLTSAGSLREIELKILKNNGIIFEKDGKEQVKELKDIDEKTYTDTVHEINTYVQLFRENASEQIRQYSDIQDKMNKKLLDKGASNVGK
jgi:hypothetical protein